MGTRGDRLTICTTTMQHDDDDLVEKKTYIVLNHCHSYMMYAWRSIHKYNTYTHALRSVVFTNIRFLLNQLFLLLCLCTTQWSPVGVYKLRNSRISGIIYIYAVLFLQETDDQQM